MTEQEFEERIRDVLADIDAAHGAEPRQDPYQDVLERFARALSKHRAIGAAVEDVPELPGGRRLVTWPKLRRDERAVLLNFARQNEALLLLGQGRREFRTPAELEAYLSQDFLSSPAFAETLALYEGRCAMPARGFLRRGGPSEVSPGDVLVHLQAEEQRKLAETQPGKDLALLVREDRLPLTSLYESGATYTCLVSGGYGMWAMFHSRAEDNRLRIQGVAMREDELG
jgi:hypothetical protein